MAYASKRRLKHKDYRVAIICPLLVEMNAVRYMLDEEHDELPAQDGDPNKYIFGQMSELNVVLGYLSQGSQGIGAAATVATHMKRSFPSANLRLLVGIGGGIPSTSHDIRLGDVVVSMPESGHGGVVQYDLGKETSTGFVRKGHLDKPPQEWRNAVVKMQSDHWVAANKIPTFVSALQSKSDRLSKHYQCPGAEADIRSSTSTTHLDQGACDKCEKASPVIESTRTSQVPEIFAGTIASGDRVIKTAEKRDSLSRDIGGALCFEMEAAGLMNDFHCVVIRGVADYADAHKNDDWHGYAAAAAAGCAKELLAYMKPIADLEPETTRYSTIPNLRVQTFVGREMQISAIKVYFANASSARGPRTLILSAMGGQGKSQIALEYCRQTKEDYHGMFWVDASSRSTTVRSFGRIAGILGQDAGGLVNDDEKVQFVLRMLENSDYQWLVVFDNYDNPADFKDVQTFRPTAGAAHLLFTSRYKDLSRLGKVLNIPPLLVSEEVRLLLRSFEQHEIDEHEAAAKDVVERLGHLVLAIDQAASYICYRRLKIEQLGQFLEAYELEREKILKHIPNDFWEYGSSLEPERAAATSAFTTWEMSLQQLCQQMPDCQEDVVNFFSISAYLAPISIDEWIFRNHWELSTKPSDWMQIFPPRNLLTEPVEKSCDAYQQAVDDEQSWSNWSHDNYWQLIERADGYSLVQNASAEWTGGKKNVKFVLHPLIRDWLQLRQHPEERQRLTRETIGVLVDSIRAVDMNPKTLASVKQTMLLHLNASLENEKSFTEEGHRLGQELDSCNYATWFGKFYYEQGLHDREFQLFESIFNTKTSQLGRTHEQTMDAAFQVGYALLCLGKYSQAEQRLMETLTLQQEILDYKHPLILITKRSLGNLFTAQAKDEEAERLLRDVLEIEEKLFDGTDPGHLDTMTSLSIVLRKQGKYLEAEKILRDLYSRCRGFYGAHHRKTVDTRQQLAFVLLEQGQVQEAKNILQSVLQTWVRILGPDHPDTLYAKHELARTIQKLGNHVEARTMYEEVLESDSRLYGMNDPRLLTTRSNLCRILLDQGEYEKGEAILRDILQKRERLLGVDHSATLDDGYELAKTLFRQGKHAEAERKYRDVLAAQRRVLGTKRSTFMTMECLGILLAIQDRYVEAHELLEEALSGYVQLLRPDNEDIRRCQNSLARLREDIAKAESESNEGEHNDATKDLERQDPKGQEWPTLPSEKMLHGKVSSKGLIPDNYDHRPQEENIQPHSPQPSRRKELLQKLPFARKLIKER